VSVAIHEAEVLPTLRAMPDASFDAVLSDVPYGLGSRQPTVDELVAYLTGADLDMGGDFMAHDWKVPSVAVWREIYRVLKPGAPLFIFAGSRTFDLVALGMRAAGFEVKDSIMHIQGQGMPKPASTTDKYLRPAGADAKTIARWKGHGHALRPSHEPVIVARKPLDGTIAENVLAHDVGGLNVEGCRLRGGKQTPGSIGTTTGMAGYGAREGRAGRKESDSGMDPTIGRWPPNCIFTHAPDCRPAGSRKVKAAPAWNDNRLPSAFTGAETSAVHHADDDGTETVEAWSCVDGCPVRALDEQSGVSSTNASGRARGAMGFGGSEASERSSPDHTDKGTASRFFPCFQYESKVDAFERELGCEHLPLKSAGDTVKRKEGTAGIENGQAGARRGGGARNYGPCLKPVAVTTWLAKLGLPPAREGAPRRLLVPYSGTGSEILGAVRAGWEEIEGIERDAGFVKIARARIKRWSEIPAWIDPSAAVAGPKADERQFSLFGETGT
jgi:hypothetical protein